jgi:Flp pilus assembly protein TadG
MYNLLRSRRGSAAFATVIALVPLIGVVALGGEAGSWYVTKQHAQNAADGAAYSGALTLACALASNGNCSTDTQTVAYRGKEFASQSAFCNAGDATAYPGRQCAASLPTGVSQVVAIDIGDYSGGTFTTPPAGNGNAVRAKVSQQQPGYLAAVLGLTTVNIPTQAIAKVNSLPKPPCALALTGTLSFQGSFNINAPNCGMASDDTATNALDFTGGGGTMTLGSLAAAGGCSGAAKFCNPALTYRAPVTDPFSALDGALTTLCGANPSVPATCGLSTNSKTCPMFTAYTSATPCTNNNPKTTGNKAYTLGPGTPGCPAGQTTCVYFISGTLTLTGGSSITGPGVTFILLPGATIDTKGGGTLTLSGPTSAPATSSLPASLQADASLFEGMAFYDASNAAVQFGGTSNINITGNIYAPTAAVTFQGDPTLNLGGNKCGELVAASIAFNGNATFNDSGCKAAGVPVLKTQLVQLVQ